MPHKQLKSIPRRLGYILGAQWTRDLSWTIFTILLAWHSKEMLGQIMLALSYGYLVKTAADVGLNDFLLSTFVRKDADPMRLLGEVTWFKFTLLMVTLCVTFGIVSWQNSASLSCASPPASALTASVTPFSHSVRPEDVRTWKCVYASPRRS